ncbi:MAG: S24 family peptidase [Candidatus Desulfovibrio faecigallinarum]|nr:S24 family peptidase [Candidatus Desulfovibrio faecigallinarum]
MHTDDLANINTNLDRLRDFLRSRIGRGKTFNTAREMAEALNLGPTRATILYKFLKGADPRAGVVLDWLEKLGITVIYPEGECDGVEYLPVMNCRAGAGVYLPSSPEDGEFDKVRAFDRSYFRRMHINPADCCFLDVMGDSMEPLFSNGSTIMVDMSQDAKLYLVDGKIYVVRYMDGILVKRIALTTESITLCSENPLHAPITIEDPSQFEVIGRVRWYSVNA